MRVGLIQSAVQPGGACFNSWATTKHESTSMITRHSQLKLNIVSVLSLFVPVGLTLPQHGCKPAVPHASKRSHLHVLIYSMTAAQVDIINERLVLLCMYLGRHTIRSSIPFHLWAQQNA